MITTNQLQWVQTASYVLLFFFTFIAVRHWFHTISPMRRTHLRKKALIPPMLLKLLGVSDHNGLITRSQHLLMGSGFRMDAVLYVTVKRLVFSLCAILGTAAVLNLYMPVMFHTHSFYMLVISTVGIMVTLTDHFLLEIIKKRRSLLIMKEVYVLSSQLLYYAGSSMNLHGKLVRCLPHTRTIREEMNLLINEWYQDAEGAIDRFKNRLGTQEGYSFAETLQSLRLHDSEYYYDLLRQRIQDYKDKLELLKESRKEATSYILFVLAGVPILNTFKLFIYPWVAEGQKLFDSLQ